MKKLKYLFLTIFGLLGTFVLVSCNVHVHTYSDAWTYNASKHWHQATCEHSEEVSDEAEHTFGDWVITTTATEDTEGLRIRTCTVCGYKEEEKIDKIEHVHTYSDVYSYDENKHYYPATCNHDSKKDEENHTFVDTLVSPTCEAKGYTSHTCSVCGYTYKSDETDALGHNYGEWTVTTQATCTGKGVETRTCQNDSTHTETREIEPLGHDYGEWTVTTQATCTEKGVETRTCQNDSTHTETREIEPLGHDYGEWTVVTKPDVLVEGLEQRVCRNDSSHTEARKIDALTALTDDELATLIINTYKASNVTIDYSGLNAKIKDNLGEVTLADFVVDLFIDDNKIYSYDSSYGNVHDTNYESLNLFNIVLLFANDYNNENNYSIEYFVNGAELEFEYDLDTKLYTVQQNKFVGASNYSFYLEDLIALEVIDGKISKFILSNGEITFDYNVVSLEEPTIIYNSIPTQIENDNDNHEYKVIYGEGENKKEAHTYGDWNIVTEATEQNEGIKERICSVCEHKEEASIPNLSYEFSKFEWNEENHTAVALYKDSDGDEKRYTALVTSEIKTPATCEEKGLIVYTAVYEEESDTLEEEINALGHNYALATYEWSEDKTTVTAKRVCEHDESHVDFETTNVVKEVITPSNCTTTGVAKLTATFEKEYFETQVTETTIEVDSNAHKYDDATYEWSGDNSSVTATRICVLNSEHKETEIVETKSEVTTPATCEEDGVRTYTTNEFENEAFNVQTKEVEIEKIGHNYGTPEYEWNDKEVTAKVVCQNDNSHIVRETVTATLLTDTASTCAVKGSGHYEATFENELFEKQVETDSVELPLIDHKYSLSYADSSYNTETGKVTAAKKCSVCSDVVTTELDVIADFSTITADSGLVAVEGTITKTIANGLYFDGEETFELFKPNTELNYKVGDEIVAFGYAKEFNSIIELDTGCIIIYIKPVPVTITNNISGATLSDIKVNGVSVGTLSETLSTNDVLTFKVTADDETKEIKNVLVNGAIIPADSNGVYSVTITSDIILSVELRKAGVTVSYIKALNEDYIYDEIEVYLVETSKSKAAGAFDSTRYQAVDVTMEDDVLTTNTNATLFKLIKSDVSWLLFDTVNAKYVKLNSDSKGNNLKLVDSSTDATLWTISFDSGNVLIKSGNMYIESNSSNYTFTNYAETQNKIQLYVYAEDFITPTIVSSKDATCDDTGLSASAYLINEKYYSDPFGMNEIEISSITIPALGHNYGEPVWNWSSDHSTATASFVCTRDENHTLELNAVVVNNSGIYTATVDDPNNEGQTLSDTVNTNVDYNVTLNYNVNHIASITPSEFTNGTAISKTSGTTLTFEITLNSGYGIAYVKAGDTNCNVSEEDGKQVFSLTVSGDTIINITTGILVTASMTSKNSQTSLETVENCATYLGFNPYIFRIVAVKNSANNPKDYSELRLYYNANGSNKITFTIEQFGYIKSITFVSDKTLVDGEGNALSSPVTINSSSFSLAPKSDKSQVSSLSITYVVINEEDYNRAVTTYTAETNLSNNANKFASSYDDTETITLDNDVTATLKSPDSCEYINLSTTGQVVISKNATYDDIEVTLTLESVVSGITKTQDVTFTLSKIDVEAILSSNASKFASSYDDAATITLDNNVTATLKSPDSCEYIDLSTAGQVVISKNTTTTNVSVTLTLTLNSSSQDVQFTILGGDVLGNINVKESYDSDATIIYPETVTAAFKNIESSDYVTINNVEHKISILENKTYTRIEISITFTYNGTTRDVALVLLELIDVTDTLNYSTTGATGTSYSEWSGKTATSDAVYAGNSAGGNSSIQLNSTSPKGIVSTTSGGKLKSVTLKWNSNTPSGRTVNIYGSNTAYTKASELYASSTQGTLLGTIVCGTSTELTIDGDYAYIGLRSASSALYLDSITIVWTTHATLTTNNN